MLDGGAPFYRTYGCADGQFAAVSCIEPEFFAAVLDGLGLDQAALPDQSDEARWPQLTEATAAAFARKTRDQWTEIFATTDACVTPVLAMGEVADHPHIAARGTVVRRSTSTRVAPAPRFCRTSPLARSPDDLGRHDVSRVLGAWSVGGHGDAGPSRED